MRGAATAGLSPEPGRSSVVTVDYAHTAAACAFRALMAQTAAKWLGVAKTAPATGCANSGGAFAPLVSQAPIVPCAGSAVMDAAATARARTGAATAIWGTATETAARLYRVLWAVAAAPARPSLALATVSARTASASAIGASRVAIVAMLRLAWTAQSRVRAARPPLALPVAPQAPCHAQGAVSATSEPATATMASLDLAVPPMSSALANARGEAYVSSANACVTLVTVVTTASLTMESRLSTPGRTWLPARRQVLPLMLKRASPRLWRRWGD